MRRTESSSAAAAAALAAHASVAAPVPVQAPSFAEAIKALEATIASDRTDPLIEAAALPRLYHHGKETVHAVVLYHGFTSCPQQFDGRTERSCRSGCYT